MPYLDEFKTAQAGRRGHHKVNNAASLKPMLKIPHAFLKGKKKKRKTRYKTYSE